MAFSDELKNDVIDVDSYNQEVKEYLPKLTEDYISKNNEFLNEYFSEIKFMLGIDEDISNYSFERKKDFLKKELTKYDLTFADTDSHEEEQFEKKYKEFLENQEKDKKIVIEKVIKILKYTQDEFAARINEFNEKLENAKLELENKLNEIKEKEEEIKKENEEIERLNEENESLSNEYEEINNEIAEIEAEISDLESKDSLTDEEKERLESLKDELTDLQDKSDDIRLKINDNKSTIREKQDNITDLTKEKEDLISERNDNLKVYGEAEAALQNAREAYLKNGEEIKKVAEENNIDIDGIFDEKVSEEKESDETVEKEQKDKGSNNSKDTSTVAVAPNNNAPEIQPEETQLIDYTPSKYDPNVLNDFANCSNKKERFEMYINNTAGFSVLASSIQNRRIFDFWKNHRVKRAIEANNKELLNNMKDSDEYISMIDKALGSKDFNTDEREMFSRLFDKDSNENILNGFSKYSDKDVENMYNVINRLNTKDFRGNSELAKKINSEIMPYIKSGILYDYANRKSIGRFSSKHELTGKNQLINYITNETTNYSTRYTQANIEQNYKSNPFTSELSKYSNREPVVTAPQPETPTRSPKTRTR